MQFIIIAKDAADEEALSRRMAAREAHLAHGEAASKTGEQIIAASLLDQDEQMRGSVLIVDFEDIDALNAWLKTEAYITGNVWQDIDVIPCKLAPAFSHLIKKGIH